MEVVIVERGIEAEEGDLGLELLDLALQLLLRLARLLVALLAGSRVHLLELLSARLAPHFSLPSLFFLIFFSLRPPLSLSLSFSLFSSFLLYWIAWWRWRTESDSTLDD